MTELLYKEGAAQQINGCERQTATFLLRCLVILNLRVAVSRQLNATVEHLQLVVGSANCCKLFKYKEQVMTYGKVLYLLTLCCIMFSFGCGKTTPKGVINRTDFRSNLKADVLSRAPADSVAQEHSKQVDVGEPAAKVLIRWRTFKDGESSYILSASVEVLEAASGVELKEVRFGGITNHGTVDKVVMSIPVLIDWDSAGSGNKKTFNEGSISSTGEWLKNMN